MRWWCYRERERAEEVIDWKRTECRTWIGGRPYIRTLGIKESWAAQGRLLVGLVRKYCSGLHSGVERVLVQERLRRAMEEAGLRGLAWAPLSACHDPDSGVRVERLRAYLREHPEDAEAWRELGWEYRALLQHEAGLEAIERALRLRPDEAESWECRGRLLEELGEQEEALESYRRTVELGGGSATWGVVYAQLCEVVAQEGESGGGGAAAGGGAEEARGAGGAGVVPVGEGVSGAEGGTAGVGGVQASDRGRTAEGRHLLVEKESLLRQGQVLEQLGRLEEALATYEQGLKQARYEVAFWRGKVGVLRALGREEETGEVERELRRCEQLEEERRRIAYPFLLEREEVRPEERGA